jgi:2-methylcitrate dehydratase PrpD
MACPQSFKLGALLSPVRITTAASYIRVRASVSRAKPLSQWKSLASAQSALEAMNTLFLARRGVEGPLQVVEGANGIDNLLHMSVSIGTKKSMRGT